MTVSWSDGRTLSLAEHHLSLCTEVSNRPYLVVNGLTLYGPVVYRGLGNQGNRLEVDPLPEDHFICHCVCLHLALHLNVEYL